MFPSQCTPTRVCFIDYHIQLGTMRAHVLREWPYITTAGHWTQGPVLWVTVLITVSPTGWLVATHFHPSWVQTNNSSCGPCIFSRHTRYSLMLLVDELNFPLACLGDRKRLTPGEHGLSHLGQQNIGVTSLQYIFTCLGSLSEMLLPPPSTPLGTIALLLVKVQGGTSFAQIFLYEDWQLYSAGTLNPHACLPDGKGHLLCQDKKRDKTSISDELGAVPANSEQRGNKHPCSLAVQQSCQVDLFWITDGFLADFIIQLATLQLFDFFLFVCFISWLVYLVMALGYYWWSHKSCLMKQMNKN